MGLRDRLVSKSKERAMPANGLVEFNLCSFVFLELCGVDWFGFPISIVCILRL